jgi:predicted transcriptional regulator
MTAHRSSASAPKKDEILTIRVSGELAGAIRALASANDETMSRVVRQALRDLAPVTAKQPAAARVAVAPAPAKVVATRETLCRHLGLNPAKAYGGEIRQKAAAVASGSRLMNSSPKAAAALRAHLGLPAHCTDDAVKAIVWSLTTPAGSTIVNPYAARLARQGK